MKTKVDMNKILNGKTISMEESLKDITPVNWSKEVLDGVYKNDTIIKSVEENSQQQSKKLINKK